MAGPIHSTRASNIGARATGTDVLVPAVLVREGLYRLTNRLVIAALCRRYTDEIFGYNVTAGICYIKKPFYMSLPSASGDGNRTLLDNQFQEVSDEMLEVEIDQRERIGFSYYDTDKTLSIVDWTTRYVQSGIEELAERVEEIAVEELTFDPYYTVSGGGDEAFTPQTCQKARAYAEDQSIPSENNYLVINPVDYVALAEDFRKINTSMPEGSMMSSIVTSHYKGELADYKVYTSNKLPLYKTNNTTGTLVIDGTPGSGSWSKVTGSGDNNLQVFDELRIDGSSSTNGIKKGTVLTVAGVYERKLRGSRESTERLFKFVVQSDVTTTATANADIVVPVQKFSVDDRNYPCVSAFPANDAKISVVGGINKTLKQQIFWHRDAMNMVAPSLVTPDGAVESGKAIDQQTGISMQYVKDYDITKGKTRWRVDTIFGFKMLRPELAIRNVSPSAA